MQAIRSDRVEAPGVDRSLLSDLVLSGVGIAALVVVLMEVFAAPSASRASGAGEPAVFGHVSRFMNDVRRRETGSLVWKQIDKDDAVFERDVVFVAEDSEAVISLKDGSRIEIDENSLVVVRHPEIEDSAGTTPITVDVLRGGVSGRSGKREIAIRAGQVSLELHSESRVRVRLDDDRRARIELSDGRALFKAGKNDSVPLSPGQRQEVDSAGKPGPIQHLSIRLAGPEDGKRIVFADQAPGVHFRWEAPGKEAVLFELSRDPSFKDLVASTATSRFAIVQKNLDAGVYYWRVRSRQGAPSQSSEERKLTMMKDRPPVPYMPREDEIVFLPEGARLMFAWSEVPGADSYTLDVRKDDAVIMDIQVDQPSHLRTSSLPEGRYCYRVRSDIQHREASPWSKLTCFRVITRPLPRAPRLFKPKVEVVPADEQEDDQDQRGSWLWFVFGGVAHAQEAGKRAIVLRWEAIPGITAYVVEIAEDRDFNKVVVQKQVPGNFYRWHTLTHRNYYWRVKSVDAEGRQGVFSQPRIIGAVVLGPRLLLPEPGATITTRAPSIALSWRESNLISRYIVEVASDASFNRIQKKEETGDKTSFVFRPKSLGTYHWRVYGIDLNGLKTRPSEIRSFKVVPAPPTLLQPPHDQVLAWADDLKVGLRWSTRPVSAYQVELAQDRGFHRTVIRKTRTKNAYTTTIRSLGRWFWRVRGTRPLSPWSKTHRFLVLPPSPVLVAPEDGAISEITGEVGSVTLSWQPVKDCRAYLVELVTEDSQAEAVLIEVKGTSTTRKQLAAGRYRWSVKAVHTSKVESRSSTTRGFELKLHTLLSAPVLISPGQDQDLLQSRSEPLMLSWKAIEGAAQYALELSRSGTFVELTSKSSVTTESASIRLPGSGKFFWRVCAIDKVGRAGSWSKPGKFNYRIPEPDGAQPVQRPPLVYLTPHIAFFYNLGEITTARFGGEIDVRLPLWERRIGLTLLVGYYGATAKAGDDESGLVAESRLHTFPIELVATCRFPAGSIDPYLGVGAGMDITYATVAIPSHPELARTETGYGFVGVAGADVALGPGVAFLELRYTLASVRKSMIEVDPGGLTVGIGYRLAVW